ncbi:MAG: MauE/DoxX family redox-associated membrane protein [Aequorivita antarctica]
MDFTIPYIESVKRNTVVVVSYLFVLLFLYAAISKLLAFETFTVQLAQSPLLSAYAGVIAWAVPGLEILIAILLTIPKYRIPALYVSFTLMVMFTTYIYIILNFSEFIPCSCGGVLEKLSWTQHLIFNVVFIILAGVAILVTGWYTSKKTLFLLATLAIFGIGTVTLLFAFSEKKMHRNNAFQRRYPHHPANKQAQMDLEYNSYYFAGVSDDSIYLGNHTASLLLLSIDKNLEDTLHHRVNIFSNEKSLNASRYVVTDNELLLVAAHNQVLLHGIISNYKVSPYSFSKESFMNAVFMKKDTFGIRAFDNKRSDNVLGRLVVGDSTTTTIFPELIKKQGESFFSSDGLLLYNRELQKVIYVYYYRNAFVVANKNFTLDYLGKTIDTVATAQLSVHTNVSRNEQKLGGEPLFVNLLAATYNNYLFIHSDRLGSYESKKVLKHASIIDVYNLEDQSYAFSFYLYHHNLKKLRGFVVKKHKLYALIDHYLISYNLKKDNFIYTEQKDTVR